MVTIPLPDIIRHAPNAWVPVHKYVKRSGITESDLPVDVKRAIDRPSPKGTMRVSARSLGLGLTELVDEYGIVKALDYVCSFSPSDVRPAELRTILADHLEAFDGGDPSVGTAFGKAAVCWTA
jgi:hypothetical protein